MLEDCPRQLGPYQLVEFLGHGGMAEVYRARRDRPGGFVKDVALKKMLPSYGQNKVLVQRFMEEARIAGALIHGNIMQVYDFGLLEDEYYIVMEYIDGLPLATVLDRCVAAGVQLPAPIVAHVGAEVCSGLSYAHAMTDGAGRPVDVVHRDVSPQNIMLSFAGDVKLGDFGIAKAADSVVRTETGLRLGKTCYMSPEQAAGEPLDGRSDLFALAVTLWEALTLKPLLPRGDAAKSLEALARCSFRRPSHYAKDLPGPLEDVVMQGLARSRERRFRDGVAMARALRTVVHTMTPGFGRQDVVDYLQWLRPQGPPRRSPPKLAISKGATTGLGSRWSPGRWPWLVLAAAPLLGATCGGATYGAIHLLSHHGSVAAPVVAPDVDAPESADKPPGTDGGP
jgi:serine/threonine protein kinase